VRLTVSVMVTLCSERRVECLPVSFPVKYVAPYDWMDAWGLGGRLQEKVEN